MINLRSTSNLSGEGWINTGLLPMSGTTNEWLLGTLRDGETVSFSSVDRDSTSFPCRAEIAYVFLRLFAGLLVLYSSTNCLQRSFIRTRSPRVSTPRRIKELSDIDRITSGSTFSSANRSKSVPRPNCSRMDSILMFSTWRAR